ncbi:hypothetical protein DIPPA_15115 [Diplonema papillatum]|nr:hypothetical protein DIPPA_15115 [Diplonema papillatum]
MPPGIAKGGTAFSVDSLREAAPADEQNIYSILKDEDLEDMTELQKTRLDFRFWKQKAQEYHFGEGELVMTVKTTFPRLEHFPKCQDVAKDWMRCKAINRWLTPTGICNPLRDQVAMCINDTWVERYKFRSKMHTDIWLKQEILSHGTHAKSHYDRAFLGMMVDDHDAD